VEILTSKKQKPEPEWQEIAVTARAKDSIKKYFKKHKEKLKATTKIEDQARNIKIQIKGEDSVGILVTILDIICNRYKTNIRDLHVISDGPFFLCNLEITFFKRKVVSQMCMDLRSISSVTAVNVFDTCE
jgi:(p)ppGpp synthase/HD superfamily hydrolase